MTFASNARDHSLRDREQDFDNHTVTSSRESQSGGGSGSVSTTSNCTSNGLSSGTMIAVIQLINLKGVTVPTTVPGPVQDSTQDNAHGWDTDGRALAAGMLARHVGLFLEQGIEGGM